MAEVFRVVRETIPYNSVNYDVRPTTRVPSLLLDAQGNRQFVTLPWMWKHERFSHPNAKSENVVRYPTYRESFRTRRCIVPARGFYEWRPIPDTKLKQRYYIERTDGRPLAFAGLYSADSEMMATITTLPNAEIALIHDRTPVTIEPADWDLYLSHEPLSNDDRRRMLAAPPDGTYRYWPVANNAVGPDLLVEVKPLEAPSADAPLPTRPRKKAPPTPSGRDLFS